MKSMLIKSQDWNGTQLHPTCVNYFTRLMKIAGG